MLPKRAASARTSASKRRGAAPADDDGNTGGSAAQQTTLASFVAGSAAAPAEPVAWRQEADGSLLVGETTAVPFRPSARIAAFDFDDTLAGVNGSHAFPKSGDDWSWVSPLEPAVLWRLHQLGFAIVIFSNQKGYFSDKPSKNSVAFKGRVAHVVRGLAMHAAKAGIAAPDAGGPAALPMLFVAAAEDDFFRKPRPGMWHHFVRSLNGNIEVDTSVSFYCGDAAGRTLDTWGSIIKSKDHAASDYKFALNAGIRFLVPETLFHQRTLAALDAIPADADIRALPADIEVQTGLPPLPAIKFDPRSFSQSVAHDELEALVESIAGPIRDDSDASAVPGSGHASPIAIICTGAPASGKSSFVRKHLHPRRFVHINQDTLKTRDKCIKALRGALEAGSHVVVDNTNPDRAARADFLSVVQDFRKRTGKAVRVYALSFDMPLEMRDHNHAYREVQAHGRQLMRHSWGILNQLGDHKPHMEQAHVPGMVIRMFNKRFEPPTTAEGFDAVHVVPFHPHFENEHEEALWRMFYA
ncbi:DNA kinase/phosphatase Pnk1 [Polyrhizophydium stewartii]|uniref:DNA kinase/phosphatase Pnk1 n=1 Tax=Polyrhizophydium stewartii TaxID=2732419 RepID=A0ABR4NKT0_9FUNG|nr:hypothetical protein HK105_006811 [Polyrhizophydium stewartii]